MQGSEAYALFRSRTTEEAQPDGEDQEGGMTPTVFQIRQALINTLQQPRSDARLIYEALERGRTLKTPAATGVGIPCDRNVQRCLHE